MSLFTVRELNWDYQSFGTFLCYFCFNNLLKCISIKPDLFTQMGIIDHVPALWLKGIMLDFLGL